MLDSPPVLVVLPLDSEPPVLVVLPLDPKPPVLVLLPLDSEPPVLVVLSLDAEPPMLAVLPLDAEPPMLVVLSLDSKPLVLVVVFALVVLPLVVPRSEDPSVVSRSPEEDEPASLRVSEDSSLLVSPLTSEGDDDGHPTPSTATTASVAGRVNQSALPNACSRIALSLRDVQCPTIKNFTFVTHDSCLHEHQPLRHRNLWHATRGTVVNCPRRRPRTGYWASRHRDVVLAF